ncbi:hypothetical protein [Nocardia sp. NPDC046763]|uniref:DUF7373 family lipoprotein n=1 Tax=Nocardia sp. NPDC046763 TaxID=3155256 RepID=UPI0033FC3282
MVLGIAAVVAVPALAGCASDVSGTAAAAEVDVRQLPVGNYPTDPLDVRATYRHGSGEGSSMAIARLADSMVIGADVDPSFSHNVLYKSLKSASSSYGMLADPVRQVLENDDMVYGYSTASSTKPLGPSTGFTLSGNFQPFGGADVDPTASTFNLTVIQFADQQRAQTAERDIEAADFNVAPDQNVHVTLTGNPTATAHWRPGVPSLAATLTYGLYVVDVFVQQSTADLDGLRGLADKVLAAQLPMLDRAPGLSTKDLYRLDFDPDDMLRRTLHPSTLINPNPDAEITHATRGFLHYIDDQTTWKPLLDNNGVDRISEADKGSLLFRARDPKSAAALWTGITALTPTPAEAPAKVPDVACADNHDAAAKSGSKDYDAWNADDKYICTVRYDRYVARVASNQLIDVQQKAAAQYALLANSQYL